VNCRKEEPIQPSEVEIDLTNTCNQNCYYCNAADFRAESSDATTIDDYLRLIRELPKSVNTVIFAGGGEPLASKFASRVINAAIERAFKVGIITNGTLLSRLKLDPGNYPTWIGIDIDTIDSEAYTKIRGTKIGRLLKEIKNIPRFQQGGTTITFKYLINHYNADWTQIKNAIDFATTSNFDEFFVRIAHFKDGRVITPEVPWSLLEEKISGYCKDKIIYKSGISKERDFLLKKFKKSGKIVKKCFGPDFSVIFAADGLTYWCTEYRGEEEYVLGNWKEKGYASIFKPGLANEMSNFTSYHQCAIQCKYFDCFE